MFPVIPGVEFKLVEGHEGYAISSDGRLWCNLRGRGWRKMESYTFCDGDEVVRFHFPSSGFGVYKVKDLMKQHFLQNAPTCGSGNGSSKSVCEGSTPSRGA